MGLHRRWRDLSNKKPSPEVMGRLKHVLDNKEQATVILIFDYYCRTLQPASTACVCFGGLFQIATQQRGSANCRLKVDSQELLAEATNSPSDGKYWPEDTLHDPVVAEAGVFYVFKLCCDYDLTF